MANYNLFDVWEKLCVEHVDNFDISPSFVYLIDIVNSNALSLLANQFDIEGIKGYGLADTEEKKRNTIKNAIANKKSIGTIFSIKQALFANGFENVEILEGAKIDTNYLYNGQYTYNGQIKYGSTRYTDFIVKIYVEDKNAITEEQIDLIKKLIDYNKRATSYLLSLQILNL